MDADYTNTNLKPTEISNYPFLYCCDEEIRKKYAHVDFWGKWMMFFKRDKLDDKWAAACELYHQGKLTGISSMKVSTAFDNDRASSKNTGVIIFYCGPPGDRAAMMEYGKNLLAQFPYETRFGYMYYKTDAQTALGSRATGRTKNSLYKIPVPSGNDDSDDADEDAYWSRRRRGNNDWWYRPGAGLGDSDEEGEKREAELDEEHHHPEPMIEMPPACTNTKLKPSQVTDHPYLFRCDEQVRNRYSHVEAWGKWLMFFPKDQLDKKWSEACEIYDCGRLWNVAFMKVSTAHDSERSSDKSTGVIAFYCGPAHNRIAMLEIGNNILDYIPYESESGYMYYKSEVQTALGTRATGRGRNSLFSIRLGKKGSGSNDHGGAGTSNSGGSRRVRTRGGGGKTGMGRQDVAGSKEKDDSNALKKYKTG